MNRINLEEAGKVQTYAVIMQLLGCVGWGLSYIFIKKATSVAPDSILLGTRFLLAFILLNLMLVLGFGKIKKGKRSWRPLVLQCLSEPIYFICETMALKYVTITLESVMLATVPVFAIVTGFFILKEVPTRKQLICCIFAVIGVIAVTISGKEIGDYSPKGIIVLVMACVMSALYRTFNKQACREFSFFERTYFVIGTCMVFNVVLALKEVNCDFSLWFSYVKNPDFIIPTAILAIFCSVIGSMLINSAMQGIPLVVFSIIALSNTVIAVISGVLIEGDNLTLQVGAGICLTLLSILGVSITVKRPGIFKKKIAQSNKKMHEK